ncbi:MAG TPA: molybdopterin biosynthesis protein, partial [Dissulfurispiraceae bacterium]|nr:molybdopterin biosynthesis protein [Dissulfurispiraceae bacterium]
MKKVFRESPSLKSAEDILMQALAERKIHHTQIEHLPVPSSRGRITAAPVFARYSSPAFHSSAMDGYAVRFRDTVGAAETSPLLLRKGEAAHPVDTGDPLPEGFDAVVMIEDVNVVGDSIEIYSSVAPYQHVRIIGEDIVATELILPENHRIRPVDMGAMLASGHLSVPVRSKPRVGIIPSGTELIDADAVRNRPPVAPEIIEYNSVLLA